MLDLFFILSILLFGLLATVFALVKPRVIVALSIFGCFIQIGWFYRFLDISPYFKRVPLALIGITGCVLLLEYALKRFQKESKIVILKPTIYMAIFLIALTMITNIYNDENIVLGFFELRYYFASFVLTFSIYTYYGPKLSIDFFKKCLVIIGLAQIPFVVIQNVLFKMNFLLREKAVWDAFTGTFSTYAELVSCQIVAIGIVLIDKFMINKHFFNLNSYLLAILLVVPLLLSGSRLSMVFVLLLVLFCWIYFAIHEKNYTKKIMFFFQASFIGILFIVLFLKIFWKTYDIHQQFDFYYIIEYLTRDPITDYYKYKTFGMDPVMGRLRAVSEAFYLTFQHPVNALIGYGSGATSETSFLAETGKYYQKVGPLAGIGRNQYSKIITEFGLIGLFGFIQFFYSVYKRLRQIPTPRNLVNIYSVIVFSLLILSIYAQTVNSYFYSVVIGFFLATVQVEYDRRKTK